MYGARCSSCQGSAFDSSIFDFNDFLWLFCLIKVVEPVLLLGAKKFEDLDIRVRVRGGGSVAQVYGMFLFLPFFYRIILAFSPCCSFFFLYVAFLLSYPPSNRKGPRCLLSEMFVYFCDFLLSISFRASSQSFTFLLVLKTAALLPFLIPLNLLSGFIPAHLSFLLFLLHFFHCFHALSLALASFFSLLPFLFLLSRFCSFPLGFSWFLLCLFPPYAFVFPFFSHISLLILLCCVSLVVVLYCRCVSFLDVDEASKKQIKDALLAYDRSLFVADPRRREPKKCGGPGARARFQKAYRWAASAIYSYAESPVLAKRPKHQSTWIDLHLLSAIILRFALVFACFTVCLLLINGMEWQESRVEQELTASLIWRDRTSTAAQDEGHAGEATVTTCHCNCHNQRNSDSHSVPTFAPPFDCHRPQLILTWGFFSSLSLALQFLLSCRREDTRFDVWHKQEVKTKKRGCRTPNRKM